MASQTCACGGQGNTGIIAADLCEQHIFAASAGRYLDVHVAGRIKVEQVAGNFDGSCRSRQADGVYARARGREQNA